MTKNIPPEIMALLRDAKAVMDRHVFTGCDEGQCKDDIAQVSERIEAVVDTEQSSDHR